MEKEKFICIDLFKRISSKTSHKTKRNLSLLNKKQTAHLTYRNASHPHQLNIAHRSFYDQDRLKIYGKGRNKKVNDWVGRVDSKDDDQEDLKGWSITQQQQNRNYNRNQIFLNRKRCPQNLQKHKKQFLHINTTPHLDSKPLTNIQHKQYIQHPPTTQVEKIIKRSLFTSRNNKIYNKQNKQYVDLTIRSINRHRLVHNFDHLTKFQNWIKNNLKLQHDAIK